MTLTPTRPRNGEGTPASTEGKTGDEQNRHEEEGPAIPMDVAAWVESMAALTTPDRIVWCDGSAREFDLVTRELVASGTLTRLNPEFRPYSFQTTVVN